MYTTARPVPVYTHVYRADWEPEAPSGKSMAGVPGVFWRCLAALQGPSTHNPAWVAGKTLILKNWPIYGRYGHIHRYRGPDSHMQSGVSPGSSVGDTNDWILFLWFILIVFCPWFRSATSHPVQNTQNHRFLTQNTIF